MSKDHKISNTDQFDPRVIDRTIVLVGLMGAGKSAIGRRLADHLGWQFVDADHEIEAAAGCSITDIFALHGEAAFRDGERRVIARLLSEREPHVLATGGGAFMDTETRKAIRDRGVSVWLKADLDVLYNRVIRRNNRPLLAKDDPKLVLADLIKRRYPVYATADIAVESVDGPHEDMVKKICKALARWCAQKERSPQQGLSQ